MMITEIKQGDIEIEEMPQGCVLSQKRSDNKYHTVVISYPDDAIDIILSLIKMVRIQHNEYLPDLISAVKKEI